MKEIVTKYLEGRATVTEQNKLLVWLRNKENRIVFNSYRLVWMKSLEKQELPVGSEDSWNQIQAQLVQKSYLKWQNSKKLNQFFRIAAIFFFVVSLGSAVYYISNKSTNTPEFYTSVLAEKGQISKVELPDGSKVWLNSGSKITYSNSFASNNRDIKLNGEAYFQVTKNEGIPLVVSSGGLRVKVLGTKFNVAAYPVSDNIDVVLESGKVELLSSKVASFQYFLKPGERASFNKTNKKLGVSRVNVEKYTSWKDGMINIYDQTLEELVKRLETRYNQKFKYSEELRDYHFTFTIKNETLEEIIQVMEKIAPIKTVQKGEIIEFSLDEKRQRVVGVN